MSNSLPPALLADIAHHTGDIHSVTAISGGITNHNYRVDAAGGRFMLRVAGARTELLGIQRQHEFGCATLAHKAGVGAEMMAFLPQHGALLARFIEHAETLTTTSAAEPARLARIVAAFKRYHTADAFPTTFSPFQTVCDYVALALQHETQLPADMSQIFAHLTHIEQALRPHAHPRPCHNDLLPGNLLDDGHKIWIVDWEYAGNGNLFFDLGNFAANLELDEAQCQHLLTLYFGKATPHQLAQLHLMRLVSDLREAFWGYLQAGISSLDFDFMAYGAKHVQRFRDNVAHANYHQWLAILENNFLTSA